MYEYEYERMNQQMEELRAQIEYLMEKRGTQPTMTMTNNNTIIQPTIIRPTIIRPTTTAATTTTTPKTTHTTTHKTSTYRAVNNEHRIFN